MRAWWAQTSLVAAAALQVASPDAAPAPGPPPSASASAQPPPQPAAPAPAEPERRDAAPDDVADYTLTARLDTTLHTLHGEGTLRWKNASATPVREIWVHLYLNAFKNQLSTFVRDPVGHSRGSAPVRDWGAIDVRRLALRGPDGAADLWPSAERHREGDADETDARVPLPRDVLPGESVTFEVTWDDKLPQVVERTGFSGSFHMLGQWFPKIARLEPSGRWAHFPMHHLAEFYADFGTYDVTVDVPSSFTVGATGPVVESHVADGRRVERHVQADVHDFAFAAYDAFESKRERVGDVDVTVLFPRGASIDADRELDAVRFALPHFEALYGAYPYPVLTLVHPPDGAEEAGGMEYPTLITTGGDWYWPPFSRLVELVTIHELGHQWFYGLVATDEVSFPFLDEGLNSYAEAEALGAWRGPGSAASALGFTLSDTAVQSVFGNLMEHDEAVAKPAFAFRTGDAYADLVYERTASIVETLRRVYGSGVTRALALYTRRYRFAHPAPDDLVACFEAEAGAPAAAALRTALFDKGWVDYAVTRLSSRRVEEAAGLFDVGDTRETRPVAGAAPPAAPSYEGWVLVTRRGTLRFPVVVELTLDDGSTQRVPWNGEDESARIAYSGNQGLRAAVVDPDHAVLLDDNPLNNHAAATPSPQAPRVMERLTYWAELLLQAILP
jgi:hypothetical protein